jgi:hypothetical protein
MSFSLINLNKSLAFTSPCQCPNVKPSQPELMKKQIQQIGESQAIAAASLLESNGKELSQQSKEAQTMISKPLAMRQNQRVRGHQRSYLSHRWTNRRSASERCMASDS